MGLIPHFKIRPKRKKELKPVIIDMDKLATKEDIARYAQELKQAKINLMIASLNPRQRAKLREILAIQKGRVKNGRNQ